MIISFPNNLKYKILRSSSWSYPTKVITDETRSGASKIRMAHTSTPKTFNITLQFDLQNAKIFSNWFELYDMNGLYPFYLPKIDDNTNTLTPYRFAKDTNLEWSNVGGLIMQCSFSLEEA